MGVRTDSIRAAEAQNLLTNVENTDIRTKHLILEQEESVVGSRPKAAPCARMRQDISCDFHLPTYHEMLRSKETGPLLEI